MVRYNEPIASLKFSGKRDRNEDIFNDVIHFES